MPTEFGITDHFFSHRERPWHNMGTIVAEAPTSAEAIELANLNWKVERAKLYCEGLEVPERFGLVRDYDKRLYGIVSPQYKILQNDVAFSVMDSIMGEGVKFETAGSLFDGKTVFMTCALDQQWEIAGDKIETYLLLSNSHSGIDSLHIAVTPVRVVCNNTLQAALRTAKNHWSIRHTSSMRDRIVEAQQVIQRLAGYMSAFVEFGNAMTDLTLGSGTVEHFTDVLFPKIEGETYRMRENRERAKSKLEACLNAPDLKDLKGTAWAFINAVSDYETHFKVRSTRKSRERLLDKTLGGGTPMLSKAINLIQETV